MHELGIAAGGTGFHGGNHRGPLKTIQHLAKEKRLDCIKGAVFVATPFLTALASPLVGYAAMAIFAVAVLFVSALLPLGAYLQELLPGTLTKLLPPASNDLVFAAILLVSVAKLSDELGKTAAENVPATAKGLRESLSNFHMLQRRPASEILPDGLSLTELTHTNYFENPNFRKLLVYSLTKRADLLPSREFIEDPDFPKLAGRYPAIRPDAAADA